MIPILFENDDIIAVDKPEGLATTPAAGKEDLLSDLNSSRSQKLFTVHRLDKDASGVILFAKNPAAHRFLNSQFARREIRKIYLALVQGIIEANKGVIDKPIRQFGSGRMGVDSERGKASRTEFEVLERFKAFTMVRAFPHSGRRHQIRVHFYSIGYPIAGDLRYGLKDPQKAFPRLMLHASEIGLRLPTGEDLTVSSPLPLSFTAVCENLRSQDSL